MNDPDNPIVDMLTVRRDLYLVMSLLLADEKMAKVRNVVVWTRDFHENEVSRLMLWVATAMRGLLDLLEERKDSFSKQHCGEYWADFPKSSEYPLTFRQACNSVIHAKEILPHRAPERDSLPPINKPLGNDRALKKVRRNYADRITVRGTNKGTTTRAQLDIIRFVQIAYELSTLVEEERYANG